MLGEWRTTLQVSEWERREPVHKTPEGRMGTRSSSKRHLPLTAGRLVGRSVCKLLSGATTIDTATVRVMCAEHGTRIIQPQMHWRWSVAAGDGAAAKLATILWLRDDMETNWGPVPLYIDVLLIEINSVPGVAYPSHAYMYGEHTHACEGWLNFLHAVCSTEILHSSLLNLTAAAVAAPCPELCEFISVYVRALIHEITLNKLFCGATLVKQMAGDLFHGG
jgi:hypothetical protein